jgi:hypothetical protein
MPTSWDYNFGWHKNRRTKEEGRVTIRLKRKRSYSLNVSAKLKADLFLYTAVFNLQTFEKDTPMIICVHKGEKE